MIFDDNLSSSLQTTLAIGGAFTLVAAAAVIHRNTDRLSPLLCEEIGSKEMSRDIDWQNLTISAQVSIDLVFITPKNKKTKFVRNILHNE